MPGAMAVALLVMGCMFMLAFWGDFRATQRYGRYVKTDGVLKKSWVETSTTEEGRTNYTPCATYEYVVAGKKFTGQTITHPQRSKRSQAEADELLAQFAAQAKLEVWYDPDSPRWSCLKKTSTAEAILPVLFGGILFLAGSVGLVLG